MQFYISVMFLGLPDDIHEEKSSFSQLKKKRIKDGPTDVRTDWQTDGPYVMIPPVTVSFVATAYKGIIWQKKKKP